MVFHSLATCVQVTWTDLWLKEAEDHYCITLNLNAMLRKSAQRCAQQCETW